MIRMDRRRFSLALAAAPLASPALGAAQATTGGTMFERFTLSRVALDQVTVRVRHGGSGPPLLLLHGYPQSHMMWGKIADDLARDFTVIAPDLRGYGESSAPPDAPDHESYSKRAMARDAIELMRHFGFERFFVAGHDRGGRVAYRLALDHPDAVRKLCVLDIIPTSEVWARADGRFALGYWHWGFLAQPAPLPERAMQIEPEKWVFLGNTRSEQTPFLAQAAADYLAAVKNPSVVHAMCEDYRAGATYDRQLDAQDRAAGRKIACPVQVLWGSKGAVGAWYDALAIWRDWADDVRGQPLECGHFLAEERPAETLAALRSFFLAG